MDKEQIIREYFASIGRKGGSVTGITKARKMSREHYQMVAQTQRERWQKWRLENGKTEVKRKRSRGSVRQTAA
jgi:hypothetical protein